MSEPNEQSQERKGAEARSSKARVNDVVDLMRNMSPEEQSNVYRELGIVVLNTSYMRDGKLNVRFVEFSNLASQLCRQLASTLMAISDYRTLLSSGRVKPDAEDFEVLTQISAPDYTENGRPLTPEILQAAEKELVEAGSLLRGRITALREKMPSRRRRGRSEVEQDKASSAFTEAGDDEAQSADAVKPSGGRKRKTEPVDTPMESIAEEMAPAPAEGIN